MCVHVHVLQYYNAELLYRQYYMECVGTFFDYPLTSLVEFLRTLLERNTSPTKTAVRQKWLAWLYVPCAVAVEGLC